MKKIITFLAVLLSAITSVFADDKNYLCFTALENDAYIYLRSSYSRRVVQTSPDKESWADYTSNSVILLNKGNKIYFRIKEATQETDEDASFLFTINKGKIAASGNIMSMFDPDCLSTTISPSDTKIRFIDCTSLTSAPELPATTLAKRCYTYMFYGCTSLTTAPALPATTLADYCYDSMFAGCTSLTDAPSLPATTLASCCYSSMFEGCTSLNNAPSLPATTLAAGCYGGMFSGCTKLASAPDLLAETLTEGCYASMFLNCSKLQEAPALPATKMKPECYCGMFAGCTSLTTVPELPATIAANNCYNGMFANCTQIIVNTSAPGTPWILPVKNENEIDLGGWNYMFPSSGGNVTSPIPGTTYYIASDPNYHPHTFASAWTQTLTHHYHACTGDNCDITDYGTLTGADATAASYGQHSFGSTITEAAYYTCSVCEYVNTTRKAEYDAAAQLAADKTTFSTYKTAQKTAAEALGMSGDSDACKVLISTATTAIEALTYDESKTLAENKVAADAIVTQLTFDLATQRDADNAAGQLSSDKTAFNTYKTAQKTAAEALGKSGDSDACKALINAAITAIEALAYNESKTLAENKAAADAIVNKLGTDLDAKRAAEKAEKDKEDADQAEADRIAADKKAVEDYKSEQKKIAEGLAKAGDTAACQKLITDAKAAIDAVTYDKDKTVAAIKTSIDEIITKLKKDLEAAREANGIDSLLTGLQISVSGRELCVEGAQGVVVNVYTMGGTQVASKPASEDAITVTLPASTYLVKAGNQNCKIQIR